jgi:hypothetical protein
MLKYDHLELARIIGEPKDPKRPYPELVTKICDVDTAMPNEYAYYFDVLAEVDYIYTTVADGVTQVNVTPDTPTALTFVDIATPEYYVKITDLANAKERTLARKKATINRSLNVEENYRLIQLLDAAAIARGNLNDLKSGETSFNYGHLIDMIDQIIDYSESYVLVAGTYIDKDIKLWDWKDNKYHSMVEAFNDLGISLVRVNQSLSRDGGGAAAILASTVAYLVGTSTEEGKPLLFVRKRLDEISRLGGVISETGDQAERLVFVSPNPVQVSSTRYLAVGLIGYENIVAVTKNSYAISKFTRTV